MVIKPEIYHIFNTADSRISGFQGDKRGREIYQQRKFLRNEIFAAYERRAFRTCAFCIQSVELNIPAFQSREPFKSIRAIKIPVAPTRISLYPLSGDEPSLKLQNLKIVFQ